jgi:hypothetical protein
VPPPTLRKKHVRSGSYETNQSDRAGGNRNIGAVMEIKAQVENPATADRMPNRTTRYIFRVEPREFEPLIPAVQRRQDSLMSLSGVCKIAAKAVILVLMPFLSIQIVDSGCCTVAAPDDVVLNPC